MRFKRTSQALAQIHLAKTCANGGFYTNCFCTSLSNRFLQAPVGAIVNLVNYFVPVSPTVDDFYFGII